MYDLVLKYGIPSGGRFGDSRDGGRRKHLGLDIRTPMKTPAPATRDSLVKRVYSTPTGGISLDIAAGKEESRYLHLYEIKVKVGDYVKKGQIIALTGNSGRPTPNTTYGPHLHIEERVNDVAKDPLKIYKKESDMHLGKSAKHWHKQTEKYKAYTKAWRIKYQSLIKKLRKIK